MLSDYVIMTLKFFDIEIGIAGRFAIFFMIVFGYLSFKGLLSIVAEIP